MSSNTAALGGELHLQCYFSYPDLKFGHLDLSQEMRVQY